MVRQLMIIAAGALMLSGAIKIALQAVQQETLLIPTCLGQTVSLQVGHSGWSALHCWGCYAFVLGLAMVAGLTIQNLRASKITG